MNNMLFVLLLTLILSACASTKRSINEENNEVVEAMHEKKVPDTLTRARAIEIVQPYVAGNESINIDDAADELIRRYNKFNGNTSDEYLAEDIVPILKEERDRTQRKEQEVEVQVARKARLKELRARLKTSYLSRYDGTACGPILAEWIETYGIPNDTRSNENSGGYETEWYYFDEGSLNFRTRPRRKCEWTTFYR